MKRKPKGKTLCQVFAEEVKTKAENCLVADIGEDRILQLSNDLSEGIASGITVEWRAVAEYFRNKFDELLRHTVEIRTSLCMVAIANDMLRKEEEDVGRWLEKTKKYMENETK